MNSSGSIIMRQIRKMESAKRNAIKTDNVDKYNAGIKKLATLIMELEIPESATVGNDEKTGFNIDSVENGE